MQEGMRMEEGGSAGDQKVKTKKVVEEGRARKAGEGRKSWVLSLRLSLEERTKLAERADAEGMSLSEYARDALLAHGEEDGQLHIPFSERDEQTESEEDRMREMDTFLESVQKSARGLAKGWVNAKLLPKINRRQRNRIDTEETEG
jgi:hypothetical protein